MNLDTNDIFEFDLTERILVLSLSIMVTGKKTVTGCYCWQWDNVTPQLSKFYFIATVTVIDDSQRSSDHRRKLIKLMMENVKIKNPLGFLDDTRKLFFSKYFPLKKFVFLLSVLFSVLPFTLSYFFLCF